MQIPHFPEANHPLVKSLFHHSDHELLTLFQRYPEAGKYFTVIFCRYSPIVYTLIRHSARSPVQADYLFALTWRHIYYELGGLNLTNAESGEEALTMQNWLINMTAFCINEIKIPPTEAIHYSLQATSPPLWCYVEQALDQLKPVLRLIVLMAQTFHWSETRIAAYLQAEGEAIAPIEVANFLQEGYRMLEDKLPVDIRAIYFSDDLSKS
ncbi:sigma-70 family RNA polymerase sigma factor [Nostoc sp. MG11]|uniref:sigma-70 family RNA polymerase sigma factor n=1 Tax=Nostoc sp. MG11 TaxID=2721166 RepID=UPI001868CDB7|nr:sigma-70 family RNA polymerase sigma factor [Nostoc sp. MG11]